MKHTMTTSRLLKHLLCWFDDFPYVRLDRKCRVAELDHAQDGRVFAHVFHHAGLIICLCRAFDKLPLGHRIGILLHEIGHLMSDGGEAEADLWVQDNLDIDIDFKPLRGKIERSVQWVDPKKVGLSSR